MTVHLNWSAIDTVLLDMDGTLLDLAFDRNFWLERVPQALSTQRGISLADAQRLIEAKYRAVQHTLNWYCLDYWSDALALDIRRMTWQQRERATLREDTLPFLNALREQGKHTILLTNAHPYNLDVKLAQTGLGKHLDIIYSTHTFGYPKEDQRLWHAVQRETGFDKQRTLFIDDSEPILDAAAAWGIGYCLGVSRPDSGLAEKRYQRFAAVTDYRHLIAPMMDKQER